MIKLYYAPRTRATRPRWLLEELEVPYELVRLDLSKGEHKRPEYLAVHPHGTVPALEDEGRTLIESLGICFYLADKFAPQGLAPQLGSPERGDYIQWFFYAGMTIEPALSRYLENTTAGTVADRDPDAAKSAKESFDLAAAVVKRALGSNPFILGDRFSAADVALGSMFAWGRGMQLLKEHSELEKYLKRLTERPAFRRAQS